MIETKTPEQIILAVKDVTKWWIKKRKQKLIDELSDSMSLNPFIAPFIFDFHNLKNFDELLSFLISAHLMTGHSTGFGKLVDEKILPIVFGTHKLDKKYRKATEPFIQSAFNEIDHVILRTDGTKELLSLKAGRWTIQLSMAVQLNSAFNEILERYGDNYDRIVVGVFYGNADTLTDKYEILRGINRGANHDVFDLTERVSVFAGEEFWDWLSGVPGTQEHVLTGIIEAIKEESARLESAKLLEGFKKAVGNSLGVDLINESPDWYKLLKEINGKG